MWTAIADKLDAATISHIAALVDRHVRERRGPSKHPAVQDLRASLLGKTVPESVPNMVNDITANRTGRWFANVGDCKLLLYIGLLKASGVRAMSLSITPSDGDWFDAFAEFRWNSDIDSDGVHVYTHKGLTPERERLFYAGLSVVLPRVAVHSEDIAAAVPTMKAYVYKADREGYSVLKKTTIVAERVRALYGSDARSGAAAQSVRRGA